MIDKDVGEIAVHIGARVVVLAGVSEVLVSSTVKDLVAGSGLRLRRSREPVAKGLPANGVSSWSNGKKLPA